jgi:hypothetical protein
VITYKYIQTIFILFIGFSLSAQQEIDNILKGDTLITKSGVQFIKGQKIQLGDGSRTSNSFENIWLAGANWNDIILFKTELPTDATHNLNNETVKILEIRKFSKKNRVIYLIKLEYGFNKYWCDPEKALETGEIRKPKS